MITITITIEEIEEGKISIKQSGRGEATSLEFQTGQELREVISGHMDEIMRICGNGSGVRRDSPEHGKEIC